MAKASSRQGLIEYCLRQLGAPVLEVNVDDDQIDDLIDDAIQMFHERIFDGVEKMYLKFSVSMELSPHFNQFLNWDPSPTFRHC